MGVVPGRGTKTPPAMGKLSLSTTAREAVCHRKDPQDATETQCSQINIFFKKSQQLKSKYFESIK